ncbi:MAG: ABC transporter permease [Rhodospirillaceae bacterium]|jgi:peptide/nickel transport system permease protein|nr:ABC transporter permease [Rhodospirillaceae bacterium]
MLTTVLLRRLFLSIPTILGVATLAFVLGHLSPGDPAIAAMGLDLEGHSSVEPGELERVRTELGLDKPIIVQYFQWLGKALQGDLGRSFVSTSEVSDLVFDALPTTMLLLLMTMSSAAVIGIALGIISAVYRGRAGDYIARMIAIIGVSTPTFWFAIILILLFAFLIPILPVTGSIDEHGFSAMILPTAAIALHPAALIARMMRSSMLEVLSQDMVRTATAKGLSRWRVFMVHALRNAINPVITVIGFQFANLMGGAVAVEFIFSLPGLGSLLIEGIYEKDILVMQGAVLVIGVAFALSNLVVDLLYMVIDPRIRI